MALGCWHYKICFMIINQAPPSYAKLRGDLSIKQPLFNHLFTEMSSFKLLVQTRLQPGKYCGQMRIAGIASRLAS